MMSSWSIHVNQINRKVDGSFKITEPVKGKNLNFLDFKKFYESFNNNAGLTNEVKNHISFSKTANDPTWDYKVVGGKTYWTGDEGNTQEAFTVTLSGNQIDITVLNLPKDENSFIRVTAKLDSQFLVDDPAD